MIKLTDKQITEYLYRSYTTVDGLWFMKLEEKYGFDTALDIDDAVWKVLPKIQARILKALVKADSPVEALFECLTTRQALEGFHLKDWKKYGNDGFELSIDRCPFFDIQVKSGRKKVSARVGDTICNTVHSTWAAEFDSKLTFKLLQRMCRGAEFCIFQFRR
ncbi:MAG: DUF6125 family protein [Dehalococcoidales bacterium]|nr:DUF6125 family protein [Dehalococcoidales bacterium]